MRLCPPRSDSIFQEVWAFAVAAGRPREGLARGFVQSCERFETRLSARFAALPEGKAADGGWEGVITEQVQLWLAIRTCCSD